MTQIVTVTAVALVAAVALAASPALGGPGESPGAFRTERVASTAKWVAHLDAEPAMASKLATALLKQPDTAARIENAARECLNQAGVDPTKDLKSITAYGPDYSEKSAVAVVAAKLDRDKVMAAWTANAGHEATQYGRYTIHRWTGKPDGKDRTLFACLYSDDLVVVAGSVDSAKLAIDVLAGKSDNLSKGPLAAVLPKASPGRLGMFAGQDVVIPGAGPHVTMFKKLQTLSIEVGEADGKVFANAAGATAEAADAKNLRTILGGLVATLGLMGDQGGGLIAKFLGDPENPLLTGLADLAAGVEVGGADKTLTLAGRWEVDAVCKVAEKVIAQKLKAPADPAKAPDPAKPAGKSPEKTAANDAATPGGK